VDDSSLPLYNIMLDYEVKIAAPSTEISELEIKTFTKFR
jgi:hypothetical protein